MYRLMRKTIIGIALFLSIGLLALSSMWGMLGNYLYVFLMLCAVIMTVTSIVAVIKKQTHWNITDAASLRSHLFRGFVRNAAWIAVGLCAYLAVVPIQFSSGEFASIKIIIGFCTALLCFLEWVPRKRRGWFFDITLGIFLCFLIFQLVTSFIPPRSAERILLNPVFESDWYVFHGGSSALLNHHHFAGSQKYALDLIDPEDGQLPVQQIKDLSQYKSFGQALYSPVEGVVVKMRDSLSDQKIGEADLENIAGNHVVIRIATDAYLLMAHLQQNSVVVSEGDSVEVGQPIANIGNSGNTSQPHLHIHVMTKAEFTDPDSRPVPFSIIAAADGSSRFFRRNDIVPGRLER